MNHRQNILLSVLFVMGSFISSAVFADNSEQKYPDVVKISVSERSQSWTVSATISSPYDSPKRYADAFRVLTPSGEELGIRVLLHDHASEQPFTRSLTGVEIPKGVSVIIVQGRDQAFGWGGQVVQYQLSDGSQIRLPGWPLE